MRIGVNFNSFLVTAKGICPRCGKTAYIREFGKDFSTSAEKAGYRYKCINCNLYIKKLN